MNADLTDEQAEILAKEIDMNAKKEEREAFEKALANNPEARFWNTTDSMFWAWKARAALAQPAQRQCHVCAGNDADAPCAYTTEKPEGCLRVERLAQPAQSEREPLEELNKLLQGYLAYEDESGKVEFPLHTYGRITSLAAKLLAQPPADTIAVTRSEWISVSERMPDKACLVFYTNKLGNPRIVKAKYTPRFTDEAHGDCTDEWCEYSEEHDEYFYPEGWYECIDNWDDYAFVTINDATVTHWMPLPEYPTKSTGEDV